MTGSVLRTVRVPRRREIWAALAWVFAVAVVVAPVAAEQAVENVRFTDTLGTVPVEVTLCHNGYSALDTGLLGSIYWDRTGAFGFGACLRVTGTPEAGSTLASYVDAGFIKRNAELVNDPEMVAAAYGHTLRSELRDQFLRTEVMFWAAGLVVAFFIRRAMRSAWGGRPAVGWPVLAVVVGVAASSAYAGVQLQRWSGSSGVGPTYPLPQVAGLSFSSPQTREVAGQIEPFIEKNAERSRERAAAYEKKAVASFRAALRGAAPGLRPLPGERIVIAEADPQGSFVGTAVRTRLYPLLEAALGERSIVLRTIAGDITSNGTVAEDRYVELEADASGGLPTVAVKGDHDSDRTVDQMRDHGMLVPDNKTATVDGFRVSVANDPEFKTLFGGSVTNDSGVTEQQIGERLRSEVDASTAGIVIFHQPAAGAAYLGLDDISEVPKGSLTKPYDDGIPDLPPGTVDLGHSHQSFGPYVIWNTDTDHVTWTVVDRLGTSGGAENSPTFNRFSAPLSVPLKPISVRLQYFDTATGLQTGFASITVGLNARARISARTDVGLVLR